jgi:transcriptional regulator with XRE-family HTH domain
MSEPHQPAYTPIGFNPNRVVAYNLKRARVLRNMTQERAAEALAPYLGLRWKKQTVSMAERAAETTSRRPRQFDAADIAAFAHAFELPVAWFFMPPRAFLVNGETLIDGVPSDLPGEPRVEVADLIESVIVPDPMLTERLEEITGTIRQPPPSEKRGWIGYSGLLEELERRREHRKRGRALQDTPAHIELGEGTEES